MSGGVDSSVAAALLKKQGYLVVGVFMKCWAEPSATQNSFASNGVDAEPRGRFDECPQERDEEDARRVAAKLGIPFYTFDFVKEYKKKVVDYMIDGYKRGITPNPDVMCNREIKFGLFLEKALSLGADYIATGHYVKKSNIKNQISKIHIKNKKLEKFKDTPIINYIKLKMRAKISRIFYGL